MQPLKLITYSFDKNVGLPDRVFRVISGAAIAAAPWFFSIPLAAQAAATVFGVAWLFTGVVSRCGMYYLLGFSTCPAKSSE